MLGPFFIDDPIPIQNSPGSDTKMAYHLDMRPPLREQVECPEASFIESICVPASLNPPFQVRWEGGPGR